MGSLSVWHWLAGGSTFAALAFLVYGFFLSYANRQSFKQRLGNLEAKPAISVIRQPEAGSVKTSLFNWLHLTGRWALKHEEEITRVQGLLLHGGFRHPNAAAILYGLKAMSALIVPLPYIFFLVTNNRLNFLSLCFAFMVSGISYFVPQLVLQKMVKLRQERIDRALPDVIDLLIICMEAGLGLPAAIARVSDEIRGLCKDLYQELQITSGEMRAGIFREEALKNLGVRTGVPSVLTLVNLTLQSEKLGTGIVPALRAHGEFLRVQRTMKAEEIASKLPVKILIPMLIFIFPAIFVVLVGPVIIRIVTDIIPTVSGVFSR